MRIRYEMSIEDLEAWDCYCLTLPQVRHATMEQWICLGLFVGLPTFVALLMTGRNMAFAALCAALLGGATIAVSILVQRRRMRQRRRERVEADPKSLAL